MPNDPRVGDKDWARREGITAFAGYPLVAEGRVLGVMALFARRALSTDTLELLASIAVSLAQGIERQWAQEKLRRSEAYLADGQRLSRTGSWAWKPDTGERFWSKEVFRIYGFEEADVPPPRELVLQRVHPRDALRMQRTLEECVDEGRDFRFETRIQIPGSARKWIETVGHPVRDESGRVVEYIGTDIDITRRRRAQQLLRRAIRARYAAVLEERTRLARDMHDGLLQDVAGIALQLRALLPHLQSSPAIVAERWSQILELTERTSREARQAVAGMRSPLRSADVVTAIENAARRAVARSPLRLSVTVSGRARPVPRKVCDAAASIAREAVTNVVKHANAQTVKVSVVFARRRIRLGISDNGRGYSMPPDGALLDEHFGIVGMRERAGALGASLNIERAARGGTTVTVALPTIE